MIAISTLAPALKKDLGSYFSTTAHRDNDIIRYINSAVRSICVSRNFDFNQYKTELVVEDGTTEYNIPYQIETYYVKKSDVPVEYENFANYNMLEDKTGVLGIWGDKAECITPGTYEIGYRGYPAQITSLSGTLDIPEHFYDIILVKASYFGFMDVKAYNKANNKESIFTGMITDMAKRSSNPQPKKTKRLNKSKRKVW